jgi:hypothetical protein
LARVDEENNMKCPHCLDSFHDDAVFAQIGKDVDGVWSASSQNCPSCKRLVIQLIHSKGWFPGVGPHQVQNQEFVRPRGSLRPCPKEVPSHIAEDYLEACLVIIASPKASAALSRRCLQNLLREAGGIKHGNLANEIQEVIDSGKLPSHLVTSIDAIRNIGNFSAHPMKSSQTGDILPVEPQEAEWNLDVLESLFDFYFVQPALLQAKRNALNKKLAEAGKPTMK